MAALSFYLKGVSKSRLISGSDSKQVRSIYIDFRWNGERIREWVKERVKECDWVEVIEKEKNGKKYVETVQRVNPKVKGGRDINDRLDLICEGILKAYREYLKDNNNQEPSYGYMLTVIRGDHAAQNENELYKFFKAFIDAEVSIGDKPNFEKCLQHLKSFDAAKGYSLCWSRLTKKFYNEFVYYLTCEYENPNNKETGVVSSTVNKTLRTLKKVCDEAQSAGIIFPRDYKKFRRLKEHRPKRMTVEEEDIDKLLQFDFTDRSLYGRRENYKKVIENILQVRDIYVFSFDTGLAHAELSKVLPDQVMDDLDQFNNVVKVLDFSRTKTAGWNSIPLSNRCLEIVRKYDGRFNTLLPYFCDQHFNRICKRMFKLAGFNKKVAITMQYGDREVVKVYEQWQLLTSHTGRHSAATNLLDKTDNLVLVRDFLGHSSVKTTEIYAKNIRKKFNTKILNITNKESKFKAG